MKKGNRWAAAFVGAGLRRQPCRLPRGAVFCQAGGLPLPGGGDPGHGTAGLRWGADLHVPCLQRRLDRDCQPRRHLDDGEGQTYSYLYWEGKDNVEYDFSQGACVAGRTPRPFWRTP